MVIVSGELVVILDGMRLIMEQRIRANRMLVA